MDSKTHKITLTWNDIQELLKSLNLLPPREEIENITLTHPRQLLIHTRIPLPKPLKPSKTKER